MRNYNLPACEVTCLSYARLPMLQASYFYQNQDLTEIDTYFMIDCVLINSVKQENLSSVGTVADMDIFSTNAAPSGDGA